MAVRSFHFLAAHVLVHCITSMVSFRCLLSEWIRYQSLFYYYIIHIIYSFVVVVVGMLLKVATGRDQD